MGQSEYSRRTQRLPFRTMQSISIKKLSRMKPPINRNHIPGARREELWVARGTCGRQTVGNERRICRVAGIPFGPAKKPERSVKKRPNKLALGHKAGRQAQAAPLFWDY